ncbi:BrnT family toxin [Candidatus Roizmanbacteria bacterium]|nr:BrnT family toxin [Candidatus Roizmanbacteria bacterium]
MKILPEPVVFDWDKGNINKNFEKHEVSDKEAEEAFENSDLYIFEDKQHSQVEKRYGVFGITDKRRLLSVAFTLRKDKVRIITARDMSRRERRAYEKIKKNQADSKI